MGVNKVEYGDRTLIDLSNSTVTPETLKEGITAYDKSGELIIGKYAPKLQSKSVTPTKSAQSIKPDSGYNGLSEVSVGAIPSDYIIPSGTLSITSNGTKDVKNYASVNVNVPVPSGYIEIAGTKLYVTQFASGSYTPSADTLIGNIAINNIGFKPKIFLLSNNSGIIPVTTSAYYLTSSFMVTNNEYKVQQAVTCFLYYNTGSKVWAGGHSGSAANTFVPTENGVVAGNSQNIRAKSGMTYDWFAWG